MDSLSQSGVNERTWPTTGVHQGTFILNLHKCGGSGMYYKGMKSSARMRCVPTTSLVVQRSANLSVAYDSSYFFDEFQAVKKKHGARNASPRPGAS